jgi:predicted Zn-dependent peptidase
MSGLVWKRIVLPSGLRLLLFPRASSNTAQLSVAMEYGSNLESEKNSGCAHFLEHMIAGGSTKRIGLSRSVEQMGGFIDFSTSNEDTLIITDILPQKIGQVSETISELLFGESFEEEKFLREKKIILHEIAEASDDPWSIVDDLLKKNLFRHHPIRRPILGARKTVNDLTLKALTETREKHYLLRNTIVLLTGNFSEKDVQTLITVFSAEQKNAQENPVCTRSADDSNPRKVAFKEKSGITQTYISIGAKTIPAKHPDAPVLDVIDVIMGAGASSRLFIELREKRALAYSVDSAHDYGSDYGFFHINCAVENKKANQTTDLIHEEVKKLLSNKVSEQELTKAKDMIAGSILRTVDSPLGFSETLAAMEIQFQSNNSLSDYLGKIKTISTNDIIEVANKYLSESSFTAAMLSQKHSS